jgi:hypothetical protein
MVRMTKNFAGILDMPDLPTAVFVLDANHEAIAVAEAKRCGISCVGLVDTNSDPTQLSHPDPRQRRRREVHPHHRRHRRRRRCSSGLGQRDSRRGNRGQADLKAASAAVAASSGAVRRSRHSPRSQSPPPLRASAAAPATTEGDAKKPVDSPQEGRRPQGLTAPGYSVNHYDIDRLHEHHRYHRLNMVNDLRAQTGAGLMDCKRALVDTNGDVEAAITILRKKGAASAAKRADRVAKEGLSFTATSTPAAKSASSSRSTARPTSSLATTTSRLSSMHHRPAHRRRESRGRHP